MNGPLNDPMIGGSIVAAMAIPLAAFATSITYERLTRTSYSELQKY